MTDYPRSLELSPIQAWPGELTSRRDRSQFNATIGTTMTELGREIDALGGKNPTLMIAVTPEQLRLDGRLRAGERPYHPGVILTFETKRGLMSYANDRFTKWEDNLRGIVKELEALRGITRWVNNAGQQYGGFLAIESARAMPAGFRDAAAAVKFLREVAGSSVLGDTPDSLRALIRIAQRSASPDHGGDDATMTRVNAAQEFLRTAGLI